MGQVAFPIWELCNVQFLPWSHLAGKYSKKIRYLAFLLSFIWMLYGTERCRPRSPQIENLYLEKLFRMTYNLGYSWEYCYISIWLIVPVAISVGHLGNNDKSCQILVMVWNSVSGRCPKTVCLDVHLTAFSAMSWIDVGGFEEVRGEKVTEGETPRCFNLKFRNSVPILLISLDSCP